MPRSFPRQRGLGHIEEPFEIVERRRGTSERDLRGASAVVLRRTRNRMQPVQQIREELRESVALLVAAETDGERDCLHGGPRTALLTASNVRERRGNTIGGRVREERVGETSTFIV